jgi:drug/metabolite transporter (DMT)-like permease
MTNLKCPQCGLVNLERANVCKKCKSSFDVTNLKNRYTARMTQELQTDIQITRTKEVVIGVLLILAGIVAFLANWSDAVLEGKFRHGMAIMSPLILVSGVMMIAVPYPDKSNFPKAEFAPKAWGFFLLIGAVLGFLNWYLMNFGF